MLDPRGRMTARDALVYAAGDGHGYCTVIRKGAVRSDRIAFRCKCGVTYFVSATTRFTEALRNVPEDDDL